MEIFQYLVSWTMQTCVGPDKQHLNTFTNYKSAGGKSGLLKYAWHLQSWVYLRLVARWGTWVTRHLSFIVLWYFPLLDYIMCTVTTTNYPSYRNFLVCSTSNSNIPSWFHCPIKYWWIAECVVRASSISVWCLTWHLPKAIFHQCNGHQCHTSAMLQLLLLGWFRVDWHIKCSLGSAWSSSCVLCRSGCSFLLQIFIRSLEPNTGEFQFIWILSF